MTIGATFNRGGFMPSLTTPWGNPYQPDTSGTAWMSNYSVWLLIGGLVILAYATRGGSK